MIMSGSEIMTAGIEEPEEIVKSDPGSGEGGGEAEVQAQAEANTEKAKLEAEEQEKLAAEAAEVEAEGEIAEFTNEEWDAFSEDEQNEVIANIQLAEAQENPKVKEILDQLNADKEKLLVREQELIEKDKQMSLDSNAVRRQTSSDAIEAARRAGAEEVYLELKEKRKAEFPDTRKGEAVPFLRNFKIKPLYDPAGTHTKKVFNPQTRQQEVREMSAAEVQAANSQHDNFVGNIVSQIGEALAAEPEFSEIRNVISERKAQVGRQQDAEAWGNSITGFLEAQKIPHFVKQRGADGIERNVYSPEFIEIGNKLKGLMLGPGGASKSEEERLHVVGQLFQIIPRTAKGALGTQKAPPKNATTPSGKKIRRRPPPDVMAALGQSPQQALGEEVDNKKIMFGGYLD